MFIQPVRTTGTWQNLGRPNGTAARIAGGRHNMRVLYRRRFSGGNWAGARWRSIRSLEGRLTQRLARRLVADARVMAISATRASTGSVGTW